MPFGEMTITLDDVSALLGIPIVGKSIITASLNYEEAVTLVVDTLGVLESEARVELAQVRGNSVKIEWLRDRFEGQFNQYSARAYLLYVIGCTLFVDKTGYRVPVVYLHFLRDLDKVDKHAWGAAALAYLYRQLGIASRSGASQMSGYMTLLESWIYEHFQFLAPNHNLECSPEHPRAHYWVPRSFKGLPMQNLIVLREQLDMMTSNQV